MATTLDAVIARGRALNKQYMPEDLTNLRTGEETKCRISNPNFLREMRLKGVPEWARIRQRKIDCPYGFELANGDTVHITHTEVIDGVLTTIDYGDFAVLSLSAPHSFPVGVSAFVVAMNQADSWLVPTGAWQTVSFRRRETEETIPNVAVMIVPISAESMISGPELEFTHEVIWGAGIAYLSDSSAPAENDAVEWSGFTGGEAVLTRPRIWTWPTPYYQAFARDMGS